MRRQPSLRMEAITPGGQQCCGLPSEPSRALLPGLRFRHRRAQRAGRASASRVVARNGNTPLATALANAPLALQPQMNAATDGCVVRVPGCPELWAIARAANRPDRGEVRIVLVDPAANAAAGAWKLGFSEQVEAVRLQPLSAGLRVVMLAQGVSAAVTATVSLFPDGGAISCRTRGTALCELPPGGASRCLAFDGATGAWFCGAGTTLSVWTHSSEKATPLLALDEGGDAGTAEVAPWPRPSREWGGGGSGGVLLMLQSRAGQPAGLAGSAAAADTGQRSAKRTVRGTLPVSTGDWEGLDPLLAVWSAPKGSFESGTAAVGSAAAAPAGPGSAAAKGSGGTAQPAGRRCGCVRLALECPGKQGAAYLLLRGAKKSLPERTPPMARRWIHAAPLEPSFGVALPMCAVLEGGVALLDCTPAAVAANAGRENAFRGPGLQTAVCPVLCWLAASLPVPPGLAPNARQARALTVDADIVDTSLRLPRPAAGGGGSASCELLSCSRLISTDSAAGECSGRVLQWQLAQPGLLAGGVAAAPPGCSRQLWGASDVQTTRASAAVVAELSRPAPLVGGKCDAPRLKSASGVGVAEVETEQDSASVPEAAAGPPRGLRHVAPGVAQAVSSLDAIAVPRPARITFGSRGEPDAAASIAVAAGARATLPRTPGRAFPSTPGGSRRSGSTSSGLGLAGVLSVCARASSDWALPHSCQHPPTVLRFVAPADGAGAPASDIFVVVGTRPDVASSGEDTAPDLSVLLGGPGRAWSRPSDGLLLRPWGGIVRPLCSARPWAGLGRAAPGGEPEFPDAAAIVATASRAIALGLPPTSAGLTMKLLRERSSAARSHREDGRGSHGGHMTKLRGRIRGKQGSSRRAPVVAWPARSGDDGVRPDPLAVRRRPLVAPVLANTPTGAHDAAPGEGISVQGLRRLEAAAFRPLEASMDAISLLCGPSVAGTSTGGAVPLGTVARAAGNVMARASDPTTPLRLHAPARALFAALLHDIRALDGVLGQRSRSKPLGNGRPAGAWRKSIAASLLGVSAHRRLAKWEAAARRAHDAQGLPRPAQLRLFAKARRAEEKARSDAAALQLHLDRLSGVAPSKQKLVAVSLDHLNTRRRAPQDSDPAVCAELRGQWTGSALAGSQLVPHWEDDLAAILRAEGVQPAEAPREAEPATSQQLLNELSAALAGLE